MPIAKLFPCAAERPMRNFSLGFSACGYQGSSSAWRHRRRLPEIASSNRCVVTDSLFLFIFSRPTPQHYWHLTAHRLAPPIKRFPFGWLIDSGFWFPTASFSSPCLPGVLQNLSTIHGVEPAARGTILIAHDSRAESGNRLFLAASANVRHKA